MDKTRKQHYIPQTYLKRWANKKGKIWVLKDKNNIFSTKITNLCEERDFYRASILTKYDWIAINYFLSDTSSPIKENALAEIKNIQEIIIQKELGEKIIDSFSNIGFKNNEIKTKLDEARDLGEYLVNNIIESWYSFHEERLGLIIQKIENSEIKHINNENEEYDTLLVLICLQMFRTKKVRELSSNIAKEMPSNNESFKKINWNTVSLYLPMIKSYDYASKLRSKMMNMYIINNSNANGFITSDFPVINLEVNYNNPKPTNKATLFYPISPRKAIIVSENIIKNLDLVETEINKLNTKIIDASLNFVISNSKEQLIKCLNYCKTIKQNN